MFASVNTGVVTIENNSSPDIPEWKKILIMKKRAGNSPSMVDDYGRRNPNSASVNNVASRNGTCNNSTCEAAGGTSNKFGRSVKVGDLDFREISPPKTVTIGSINVELRSVKTAPENPHSVSEFPKNERRASGDVQRFDPGDAPDLQYGPGIVDRLRARFLNMGAKPECKPAVRRFSSLENLPGTNAGLYRVNTRGIRQNGFKPGVGFYGSGNVKKAQSMETLICTPPEQQIFVSSRRPNARFVGGVKNRILKSVPPISVLADEDDEPPEKTPSPSASPRLFSKSVRRWDYSRSVSAPNINEDELPKPDTVKHVKKIFESPPTTTAGANGGSEKALTHSGGARFRKIPGTTTTPTSACTNGAIIGSARPAVKKPDVVDEASPDAKTSAKEFAELDIPSVGEAKQCDDYQASDYPINKGDSVSANGSCDFDRESWSGDEDNEEQKEFVCSPERSESFVVLSSDEELSSLKVTPEQLPPEEGNKHSEVLSQGSQVDEVELPEEEEFLQPHPQTSVIRAEEGMVVAAGDSASDPFPKKGSTWQKPPQATTSIVFDFRGKDVKPNISLNPTPFGCRPAKVSRSSNCLKKRSGSPPGVNGGLDPKDYVVDDEEDEEEEDEEDWDEMDIGADLPAISGIVFTGENVKVGRGALLENRNKKLSIQFDDTATSTFEYPSESDSSPSPKDEKGSWEDSSFNSTIAIGSASNSRLGLSNYTPQVLGSNNDFELGISHASHRPTSLPDKSKKAEDVPVNDVVIPANPDDTGGWSATETVDILF